MPVAVLKSDECMANNVEHGQAALQYCVSECLG